MSYGTCGCVKTGTVALQSLKKLPREMSIVGLKPQTSNAHFFLSTYPSGGAGRLRLCGCCRHRQNVSTKTHPLGSGRKRTHADGSTFRTCRVHWPNPGIMRLINFLEFRADLSMPTQHIHLLLQKELFRGHQNIAFMCSGHLVL